MTKINLRIISKPHPHLQTMTKTPAKFQKDRHKIVGGVAHTRYPLSTPFDSKDRHKAVGEVAHTRSPLSIHFDSIRAWKITKFKKCGKSDKNYSEDYIQTTCTSSDHDKKHLQSFKNIGIKVGGVAHTWYLLLEGVGGTEPWKAEYYVPSLFFENAGDNIKNYI